MESARPAVCQEVPSGLGDLASSCLGVNQRLVQKAGFLRGVVEVVTVDLMGSTAAQLLSIVGSGLDSPIGVVDGLSVQGHHSTVIGVLLVSPQITQSLGSGS